MPRNRKTLCNRIPIMRVEPHLYFHSFILFLYWINKTSYSFLPNKYKQIFSVWIFDLGLSIYLYSLKETTATPEAIPISLVHYKIQTRINEKDIIARFLYLRDLIDGVWKITIVPLLRISTLWLLGMRSDSSSEYPKLFFISLWEQFPEKINKTNGGDCRVAPLVPVSSQTFNTNFR